MSEQQIIQAAMSIMGKRGGKTSGAKKRRSKAHYARISQLGVKARLAKLAGEK